MTTSDSLDNAHISISTDGDIWRIPPGATWECREIVAKERGILMQSTGLTDCHGRDIYEGDVVQISDFWDGDYAVRVAKGVVEMRDGEWLAINESAANWRIRYFALWDIVRNGTVSAIGNIHESPNLLTEGK